MRLQLDSMAIELPHVDRHPNRVPFRGVLTRVGVPSDKPPAGARGHRVMLTPEAAERALPSLLGMAIDYTPTLDRHDARRKIGVITSAELMESRTLAGNANVRPALAGCGAGCSAGVSPAVRPAGCSAGVSPAVAAGVPPAAHDPGKDCQIASGALKGHGFSRAESPGHNDGASAPEALELAIEGFLYARDFPEVVDELRRGGRGIHGMSYEIADARVTDLRAAVWTIDQFTFTGAALLRRDKAAYLDTWIELAPEKQAAVSR